ncbi:MAG: hypothetical protein VX608_10235 [Chloroflexota bacterium]|nr:hypothetical protein [Chloroflexota bacterium]
MQSSNGSRAYIRANFRTGSPTNRQAFGGWERLFLKPRSDGQREFQEIRRSTANEHRTVRRI